MDAESFKQRFLPLHPRLYRVAFAMTENTQDAEDILQEVYCRLWNRREELVLVQNPEAFCVTMVKNLCLDLLRKPQHNRCGEVAECMDIVSGLSPESEFIERDEVRRIRSLIDSLPENQRRILLLRGLNDFSMEDIEKITGLSSVNIRVLLSRARKTIREQIEKLRKNER